MKFNRNEPYNHLPFLPPQVDVETPTVLRAAITANRMLAELKGKSENLPNPAILLNAIILQEAKASSEIENIVTTNDKLFTALTAEDSKTDPHTKEVLRYREALRRGVAKLKDQRLSVQLFIELMQIIKQTDAGIRNTDGTVIANPYTKKIIYWPPEGEKRIRELLLNLEDWIHEESSLDPLVKMAVIHYQFEAIHPFDDGNGRTGRMINILYLIQEELLHQPVLYLSDYIIHHKSDYYRLLKEVTENQNWEEWTLFILNAVTQTSRQTMKRIDEIRSLLDVTLEAAKEKLPARVYSKELIELLFEQPYCKTAFLVDRGIAKRQTAAEYLKELEKAGFLERKQSGRENLYLNISLYELLSGGE